MRFIGLTLSLILTTACGGKAPGSYMTGSPAATNNADSAAIEAADAAFENRADIAAFEESLALYAKVLESSPSNRHALERLNRGWYFYGDAYKTDEQEKLDAWATAISYGKQCLALNEKLASRINAGEKEADAASEATKDDVPCLYFTASALGKWGKALGLSKTIKHLPTVKAYISRVEALDPTYFYHGPARYWGAYYAALPGFAGRDLDVSATHFAASIEGSPNYLGTRVLRAEYNYILAQNPVGFVQDLQAVIAADPNVTPALFAENTKEQEKAKHLLSIANEFFDADEIKAALESNPVAPEAPEAPDAPEAPEAPETTEAPEAPAN